MGRRPAVLRSPALPRFLFFRPSSARFVPSPAFIPFYSEAPAQKRSPAVQAARRLPRQYRQTLPWTKKGVSLTLRHTLFKPKKQETVQHRALIRFPAFLAAFGSMKKKGSRFSPLPVISFLLGINPCHRSRRSFSACRHETDDEAFSAPSFRSDGCVRA